jgi:hypothetical protein
VVISGSTLGSPAAGADVFLWRELAGQSSFQQMAQTATTDSAGHYAFTMSPMTNQAWYVTSNGMRSTTLDQQVHALVGLSSNVHLTPAGEPILLLQGRVTPSHAGEVVLIERRSGGAWRVIARPRLGHRSTYASSRRFPSTGTVQLRTVLPGDARNVRSISRTVTVTANP